MYLFYYLFLFSDNSSMWIIFCRRIVPIPVILKVLSMIIGYIDSENISHYF